MFSEMLPKRVCPVCGKEFYLRCRPREWGWFYNSSHDQADALLTLLCSGECSKEYARRKERQAVRSLMTTNAYRLWTMMRIRGMTTEQIAAETGLSARTVYGMVTAVEQGHFKEVELIRRNGEAAYREGLACT